MLEDVYATILQRLIGRYVLGLEGRNLRVAVWSGRVVLENLVLRPDALTGLLPVKMRAGQIGRLEMFVPWTKLGKIPVTLDLSGVHMLAAPHNEHEWTPQDEEAHRWAQKQATLRQRSGDVQQLLEKLLERLPHERDDGLGSLTPGLLARVLDNVQLSVSDVHLRYEDRTNASTPCAIGLRLSAAHVKSIDEHGRARFVERAPGRPVHKLVAIRSASVYYEELPRAEATGGDAAGTAAPTAGLGGPAEPTEAAAASTSCSAPAASAAAPSPSAASQPEARAAAAAAAYEAEFLRHASSDVAEGGRTRQQMLRPLSGRVLLVLNTSVHRPVGVPACLLQVDLHVAAIRLTHAQYLAVNDLLHYAAHNQVYLRRVRHAARRPASAPIGHASDWWRYALAAAKEEWGARAAPLGGSLLRDRREYITAYTAAILSDAGGPQLKREVAHKLSSLERHRLSVGQALAFRGLAAASARGALAALQRKQRRERERQRRDAERRVKEERRRQKERDRKEAEKAARTRAREEWRSTEVARLLERAARGRLESESKERERESRRERQESKEAGRERELSRRSSHGSSTSLADEALTAAREAAAAELRARERLAGWARAQREQRLLVEQRAAVLQLQRHGRGRSARRWYARLLASACRVQTRWRGAAARRSYVRLKQALLLDEEIASEAMRRLVCQLERHARQQELERSQAAAAAAAAAEAAVDAAVDVSAPPVLAALAPPPVSLTAQVVAPRASDLFALGLKANREGSTMEACELIQRAAAISLPSLNVLLSLANMRLKLGQPSAALIAYRHVMTSAEATARHTEMALRKREEALLIGGVEDDAARPGGGSFGRGESADSQLGAPAGLSMGEAGGLRSQLLRSPSLLLRHGVAGASGDEPAGDDALEQTAHRLASGWLRWLDELHEDYDEGGLLGDGRLTPPHRRRSSQLTEGRRGSASAARGRTVADDDRRLSTEQLEQLARLLLDAAGTGGAGKPGAPAAEAADEPTDGGVRLQLGTSLSELDISLLHPDGMQSLYRMRLRSLHLRVQDRSRGAFRLRMSGLPLDAYDMRRGGYHVIGVVGRRAAGPDACASALAAHADSPPMLVTGRRAYFMEQRRSEPQTSSPATSTGESPRRGLLGLGKLSDGLGKLADGLRLRRPSADAEVDLGSPLLGADGSRARPSADSSLLQRVLSPLAQAAPPTADSAPAARAASSFLLTTSLVPASASTVLVRIGPGEPSEEGRRPLLLGLSQLTSGFVRGSREVSRDLLNAAWSKPLSKLAAFREAREAASEAREAELKQQSAEAEAAPAEAAAAAREEEAADAASDTSRAAELLAAAGASSADGAADGVVPTALTPTAAGGAATDALAGGGLSSGGSMSHELRTPARVAGADGEGEQQGQQQPPSDRQRASSEALGSYDFTPRLAPLLGRLGYGKDGALRLPLLERIGQASVRAEGDGELAAGRGSDLRGVRGDRPTLGPARGEDPTAPIAKKILTWRWQRQQSRDPTSIAASYAAATTMQRLVRGWLARRGAVLLRTVRTLLQFSDEWQRGGSARGGGAECTSAAEGSSEEEEHWLVRVEKMADGNPVHSDISVSLPTPTEVICDRELVELLLDFFRSPHLAERAAQLAYMSSSLLLHQKRRLQVALDVRAPRLLVPLDLVQTDGPMLILDAGRLTFASERPVPPPSPAEAAQDGKSGPPSPTLPQAEATAAVGTGAPTDAGAAAAGPADDAEGSADDHMYETYDVRMSDMQTLLRKSASPAEGSPEAAAAASTRAFPAATASAADVIVERFTLDLRCQRLRIPAHGLAPPLPRTRLTLRVAPLIKLRLSAQQYSLLRLIIDSTLQRRTRAVSAAQPPPLPAPIPGFVGAIALPEPDPSSTEAPATDAGADDLLAATDVPDASDAATLVHSSRSASSRSLRHPAGGPVPLRHVTSAPDSLDDVGTLERLSSHLLRKAGEMLRAQAGKVELRSLLVVPEICAELRYVPHGSEAEKGLVEARLTYTRAELTVMPGRTNVDLQLRGIYARDLTDSSQPDLANSDLQHACSASPHSGRPDDVVRVSFRQTGAAEPAQVRVQLNALHLEWNAPCIATLKHFFAHAPTSAAAAAPAATESSAAPDAGAAPSPAASEARWPLPPKEAPAGSCAMDAPAPAATAPLRAQVSVTMRELSLGLYQQRQSYAPPSSGTSGAAGAPVGLMPAALCVVSIRSLEAQMALRRDSTVDMQGSMGEVTAHDHRWRRAKKGGGPPTSEAPPMVLMPRPPDGQGSAVTFRYTRIYTSDKRPPVGTGHAMADGGHVTFESTLKLRMQRIRVIWLQQWIGGAFDYLDDSILAGVIRGVSNLSIQRVWVPPNRFRPLNLSIHMAEPTVLFPRNVAALASETLLHAHSLRADLDAISVENSLVFADLPNCSEHGRLLSDRMEIGFEGIRMSSSLPSAQAAQPIVGSPLELSISITKSIERPSPTVPAFVLAAACGSNGLHLDATLEQYDLLWRIWRENISKHGRVCAGAVGVWGLLERQNKVKHISFDAAPLICTMRSGDVDRGEQPVGGVSAASARPPAGLAVAAIRAGSVASCVSSVQSKEVVTVSMPGLAFDLYDERGSTFPLLSKPIDFEMLVNEHFLVGRSPPLYIYRHITSCVGLHISLNDQTAALLSRLLRTFATNPTNAPAGTVLMAAELEDEFRFGLSLSSLSIDAPHIANLSIRELEARYFISRGEEACGRAASGEASGGFEVTRQTGLPPLLPPPPDRQPSGADGGVALHVELSIALGALQLTGLVDDDATSGSQGRARTGGLALRVPAQPRSLQAPPEATKAEESGRCAIALSGRIRSSATLRRFEACEVDVEDSAAVLDATSARRLLARLEPLRSQALGRSGAAAFERLLPTVAGTPGLLTPAELADHAFAVGDNTEAGEAARAAVAARVAARADARREASRRAAHIARRVGSLRVSPVRAHVSLSLGSGGGLARRLGSFLVGPRLSVELPLDVPPLRLSEYRAGERRFRGTLAWHYGRHAAYGLARAASFGLLLSRAVLAALLCVVVAATVAWARDGRLPLPLPWWPFGSEEAPPSEPEPAPGWSWARAWGGAA